MTFKPECCDAFLQIFHQYKNEIRHAEGCSHLDLLRLHHEGSVFFTYSMWLDEKYLDQYRNSAIFATVWPQTKALFAAPAEAWTVNNLDVFGK